MTSQDWKKAIAKRNAEIVKLRQKQVSWRKIGEKVGLTYQACKKICERLSK